MGVAYEDFLKRLKEERINRNLTQCQMGARLRMSQSHYSKAELGKRKFTFYEMQSLCRTELNVFYILTGIKADEKYRKALEEREPHELNLLLRIICFADSFHKRRNRYYLVDGYSDKVETEYYSLLQDGQTNIFYSLRHIKKYSQKKMASALHMDVKKLRDLEKGIVQPDGELIFKIFQAFYIPFYVILGERNLLVSELCYMLTHVEKNTSIEMFSLIQDCVVIMQ